MSTIIPDVKTALAVARTPKTGTKGDDPAALKEKCRQFEAILIESMFKGMRATVPQSGLLEKGLAGEIFEEMRDAEIARHMAAGQGIGIAEALFRQLTKEEDSGID